MDTERDDLMTYEVNFAGLVDGLDGGMSDEEYATWSEASASAERNLWLTAKADEEADEAAEWQRMERDVAELDDETLAEAAAEARLMYPHSPLGYLVIAAYEERMAERAEAEAR